MSWATDKAAVQAVMTGYTEVTDVLNIEEFPQISEHKCYSFYPDKASKDRQLTSSGHISSDIAVIDIAYKTIDGSSNDANYDLFITLQGLIKNVSAFAGWVERSFTQMPKKKYLVRGRLKFYLGIRSC